MATLSAAVALGVHGCRLHVLHIVVCQKSSHQSVEELLAVIADNLLGLTKQLEELEGSSSHCSSLLVGYDDNVVEPCSPTDEVQYRLAPWERAKTVDAHTLPGHVVEVTDLVPSMALDFGLGSLASITVGDVLTYGFHHATPVHMLANDLNRSTDTRVSIGSTVMQSLQHTGDERLGQDHTMAKVVIIAERGTVVQDSVL